MYIDEQSWKLCCRGSVAAEKYRTTDCLRATANLAPKASARKMKFKPKGRALGKRARILSEIASATVLLIARRARARTDYAVAVITASSSSSNDTSYLPRTIYVYICFLISRKFLSPRPRPCRNLTCGNRRVSRRESILLL